MPHGESARSSSPTRRRVAPRRRDTWIGLISLVPLLPIMLLIVPPLAAAALCDELRLRRFYRRAGRLLEWPNARDRIASGQGTLIVEQMPKGIGHAWWVEADLAIQCSDGPVVPAALHRPGSADDFGILYSEAAYEWCQRHLTGLANRVHLVRMPRGIWRQWDDALSSRNAILVAWDATTCFRSRPR